MKIFVFQNKQKSVYDIISGILQRLIIAKKSSIFFKTEKKNNFCSYIITERKKLSKKMNFDRRGNKLLGY